MLKDGAIANDQSTQMQQLLRLRLPKTDDDHSSARRSTFMEALRPTNTGLFEEMYYSQRPTENNSEGNAGGNNGFAMQVLRGRLDSIKEDDAESGGGRTRAPSAVSSSSSTGRLKTRRRSSIIAKFMPTIGRDEGNDVELFRRMPEGIQLCSVSIEKVSI